MNNLYLFFFLFNNSSRITYQKNILLKIKREKKNTGCSQWRTTKDNRKHRNQESTLREEINSMIEEYSERPQHLDQ